MGIPVAWLKNTSDAKKREEMEAIIRNSSIALSRLLDIVEEKEETLNNQEIQISDFKDGAWTYKAAFRFGQRAALKEIKDLLAFIKG